MLSLKKSTINYVTIMNDDFQNYNSRSSPNGELPKCIIHLQNKELSVRFILKFEGRMYDTC